MLHCWIEELLGSIYRSSFVVTCIGDSESVLNWQSRFGRLCWSSFAFMIVKRAIFPGSGIYSHNHLQYTVVGIAKRVSRDLVMCVNRAVFEYTVLLFFYIGYFYFLYTRRHWVLDLIMDLPIRSPNVEPTATEPSLVKIMQNYDVLQKLLPYLDVAEIIALTRTCTQLSDLYDHCVKKGRWDINSRLKRFVDDPKGFRSVMASYDALISGSFALQYVSVVFAAFYCFHF